MVNLVKTMARGELLLEMKKLKMTTKEYFQAKYAQRMKSIAEQVKVNTVWRSILDFRPSTKKGSGKNSKDTLAKPQMLMYDGSFVGLLGFKRIRDKLNNSDLGPVLRRSHLYEKSDMLDKVLDLSVLRGAPTILKPVHSNVAEEQANSAKPALMLLGVDKDPAHVAKEQPKLIASLQTSARVKPGDTLLRASQESYLNMVRRGSFNPQVLEMIEEKVILPVPKASGSYRKSVLGIGNSRNDIHVSSRLSITSPNQSGPLKSVILDQVPSETSNRALSPPHSRRSILIKLERTDASKSVHDSVRTINKESSVDSSKAPLNPKGGTQPAVKLTKVADAPQPQLKQQNVAPGPKSKVLIEKFLGNLAVGHEKFVFRLSDRQAISLVLAFFAVSKEGRFVTSSGSSSVGNSARAPEGKSSGGTNSSGQQNAVLSSKPTLARGASNEAVGKDRQPNKQPANKFSKFSKLSKK